MFAFLNLFILTILVVVEQSFIVFWIHISLLTTKVEHISKDRLSMWLFLFTMSA